MHITWDLIDILVCFIEAILLFKYMEVYFNPKFNYRVNLIIIVILASSSFFLLQFYSTFRFVKLLVYLITASFASFSYEGKLLKKFLRFLILLSMTIAIENLVVFVMMTATGQSLASFVDNTAYRLIAIAISKTILYIIIEWLASQKTDQILELSVKKPVVVKLTALLIITIIIMFLVLNLYAKYEEETNNINILALSLSIFCIFAINIYNDILKQAKEQMEISLINQQKQMQYKYAKSIEESIEEMNYLRHDISKHLSSIAWYVRNKEYDKLDKYISDISLPLEKSGEILMVGNKEISALLSIKLKEAEKNNIAVNIKSRFEEEVVINSADLWILLGNIMDNAIEACLKVQDTQPIIDLDIQTKSGYLLIDCINSLDGKSLIKEGSNLLTNKRNKEEHGLGLKIIKRIADSYEGNMDYSVEEDKFVLNVTVLNIYRK